MRWFWIDRYSQFVSGSHAVATKNVSLAEEHLHDHFPGHPVMPGSLIVEGMAQTGGLLVSEAYRFSELVVLGKVSQCEIHRNPVPGDSVVYRCEVDQIKEGGAMVSVQGSCDGEPVASAQIFFARIGDDASKKQRSLFDPADLFNWLNILGVFDVGTTQDGTPLRPAMYDRFADLTLQ